MSRQDKMNNLNTSLHSVISGDNSSIIDIPFVDDDDENQTPVEQTQSEKISKKLSERKNVNLKIKIAKNQPNSKENSDDDDDEKRDKPGPLISVANSPPVVGLRRNSFSMPALNDIDLDSLRGLHMIAVNNASEDEHDEQMSHKDSNSDIHVSSL
jgi:hypothetical protein